MRFKRVFFTFLLFFSISLQAKVVSILHMNDTHGYAWPTTLLPDKNYGGFAAMATKIKEIRKLENNNVLLVHSGDFNTGDPASDMFFARPDIEAFNLMGVDVLTLGNHEFDNKREVLIEQRKWANFPFISCNLYKKGESQSLFAPYIIKNINGLKIAILGVLTKETEISAFPGNIKDVEIKDAISEVKRYKKLIEKKERPDLIVVLTHLGYHKKEDSLFDGSLQLAENIPGLLIIDGHSHTALESPVRVNNSIIAQAGFHGRYIGHLKLDVEDKKIKSINGKLVPINLHGTPRIKQDVAVSDKLAYYKSKVENILNQKIVTSEVNLPFDTVQTGENLLAQLITDSMRDYTETDIAFLNGGGIRDELRAGRVSLADVKKAVPFPNKIFTLKMTGKEVLKVLKHGASLPYESKGHLHVSGLKWTNNKGKVEKVFINGVKLSKKKYYSVTTVDYLMSGGDGYKVLMKIGKDFKNHGILIADAFAEYLKKLNILKKDKVKIEERNIIIK